MAFPTIAARTTNASGAAFVHSASLGSPSAGEIVLVIGNFDDSAAVIIDTAASGYDWHEIPLSAAPSQFRSRVFWKIAAGGGADVLTIRATQEHGATFRACFLTYRISGHQNSVHCVSAVNNTAGANANPPSATLSGSAQDFLSIAVAAIASNTVPSGAPAGYANLTTINVSGGYSIGGADATFNGTTEDPAAFTTVSARNQPWTILIPGDSAITTNTRATQEAVETVSQSDPNARATQVAVEVVSSNALYLIASQVAVELISTNVADDVPNNDAAIVGYFF